MAACERLYILPKTTGNVQSDSHVYCEIYCKHFGVVSAYTKPTNYEGHLKVLFVKESELISTQIMSATWRVSERLHSSFYLKRRLFLIIISKGLGHS
jgi:hypothetical protein